MKVIKYYCDICEKELTRNFVSDRFKPWIYKGVSNWQAEVLIGRNKVWNDGMICRECLFELLASKQEFPTDDFSPSHHREFEGRE